MASFDELLSNLHNASNIYENPQLYGDPYLEIGDNRQFIPKENFNTIIAYEGDINSQIVSFGCHVMADNHNLWYCENHDLKWKNLSSGVEGVSPLKKQPDPPGIAGASHDMFFMMWEVPADACTQAGTLEISISIYDKSGNQVAFSWNTAKYAGLTIGGSLESVGFNFPPKDEILVIDRDTKNIVAPVGYNNTICTYGDVGMTEVYFLVNRYLGKNRELDVMNSNITIYVTMNGFAGKDDTDDIVKTNYTVEITDRNKEGLVLVTWKIPAGVTAGPGGPGPLKVMLCFEYDGKKWYSNTYSNLTVGENLFNGEVQRPSDWDMFEDYVNEAVQHYFENNNFVFNAN